MNTEYFGPPQYRKAWETQIATPLDARCLYCGEGFADGDMGTVSDGRASHYECAMRGVVGSVGHQLKKCSCYGGTEEDPPGMTYREAARAAVALYEASRQRL